MVFTQPRLDGNHDWFMGNCIAVVYCVRASDLITIVILIIGEAAAADSDNHTSSSEALSLRASHAPSHLFRKQVQLQSLGATSSHHHSEIMGTLKEASTKGMQLRRNVAFAIVFIFITVLLRGVVSLLHAVGQAHQDNDNCCSATRA